MENEIKLNEKQLSVSQKIKWQQYQDALKFFQEENQGYQPSLQAIQQAKDFILK